MKTKEKIVLEEASNLFQNELIGFGRHWSYNFYNDPKRLGFVLSRYKFAAKMAGKDKSILELGCSEGLGATILGEFSPNYLGIDFDIDAIKTAKNNFISKDNIRFKKDDFLNKKYGKFDVVVSLDVIEHISKDIENSFFDTIINNLNENGVCIIGTPNITSSQYASKASQVGHINLFSQDRLMNKLSKYFYNIFPFGMNDEIVHTGFASMSHYLFCVACHKKENY